MFLICVGTGKVWTNFSFFPPQIVYKQLRSVMIWWVLLDGWFSKKKRGSLEKKLSFSSCCLTFCLLFCNRTKNKSFQSFKFMWPCIVTCDRAWWHVIVHRDMWPCIVTKFLCNKTNRRTNFPNLFLSRNSTCFGQFLCPSSGVFHCTFGTGICHADL